MARITKSRVHNGRPHHQDDPHENSPLLTTNPAAANNININGSRNTSTPNTSQRSKSDSDNVPTMPVSRLRGLAIALTLWLLMFIQSSNMSGMTMIQGSIADDLAANESAMWFTTAYLIPMSSLSPVAGRLAHIFAPRALVLPIACLVAVGAFVSARATTLAVFIAGRVVMGLGAAGVMTLAVILVLDLTTEKRRGVFVGLVNAGFTMGVSFGAIVYGALLPVIGWVPCAIVAGTGLYLSIPSSDARKPGSVWSRLAQIDYLGATLLTSTIVLFLYSLAGDIHLLILILSLVSLLAFLAVEFLYAADPIIPLKVLSSRGVLLSCLAQLGLMSARWTVLFYAPIFMLAVRGAPPAAAGSVLIPTNMGFGVGGLLVGWLHVRRPGAFWLPSVLSVLAFSVSLYILSLVGVPELALTGLILAVLFNGLTTGAAVNYTLAHVLHLSHADAHYVTTSLLGTFRGFGGSFGTSIGGGIFYRVLRRSLTQGYLRLDNGATLAPVRQKLVSRLLGTPGLVFGGDLDPETRGVAVEGYARASRSVWLAAAVMGLLVVALQAGTGWTAPLEKKHGDHEGGDGNDEDVETEARARLVESEGVGEA